MRGIIPHGKKKVCAKDHLKLKMYRNLIFTVRKRVILKSGINNLLYTGYP